MSNFGRGGIRDIVDCCLMSLSTGKPALFLDSLKISTTTVGAETVFARGGRGNPRRIAWDASKDVDFEAEDCLISPEQLSLLLGSTMVTGAQYVPITEVITITSGTTLQLSATPYTADAVNHPMSVFTNLNNDGSTIGTEVPKMTGAPYAGYYQLSGETLTFGTTYTNQTFIITYSKQSTVNNKRITITSDQFPLTFKLVGFSLWRDQATGEDYPCRITIPKAKLLAPFQIKQESSGEPSTFTMKFTALKQGANNTMVTYDVESDSPIN